MVISLSFGLLFGTFLVLMLLPASLVGIEYARQLTVNVKSNLGKLVPDPVLALATGRVRRMTATGPDPVQRTPG